MAEFQSTIPLATPVEQTLKGALAAAALMHLHVKSLKETSIELGSVFGIGDDSADWDITVAPAPAGSTLFLKIRKPGLFTTWLAKIGDQFRETLEGMLEGGPPPDGPPPAVAPFEDTAAAQRPS